MREILFRAWDKRRKEYLSGGQIFIAIQPGACPKNIQYLDILKDPDMYKDRFELEQFTGLTDKNGVKIFEGDVVRFKEWSNGPMCWIGQVHYEHQQFVISGGKNAECDSNFTLVLSRFIPSVIETLGNIHDNQSLIGG